MQIQHGDVLLKQVGKLPKGATKKQEGKLIVAEGEATGHAHTITKDTASLWEINGVLYLELDDPAVIEHQEHKPLAIPAGMAKYITRRR